MTEKEVLLEDGTTGKEVHHEDEMIAKDLHPGKYTSFIRYFANHKMCQRRIIYIYNSSNLPIFAMIISLVTFDSFVSLHMNVIKKHRKCDIF